MQDKFVYVNLIHRRLESKKIELTNAHIPYIPKLMSTMFDIPHIYNGAAFTFKLSEYLYIR